VQKEKVHASTGSSHREGENEKRVPGENNRARRMTTRRGGEGGGGRGEPLR